MTIIFETMNALKYVNILKELDPKVLEYNILNYNWNTINYCNGTIKVSKTIR